jgi:hypothetical protein
MKTGDRVKITYKGRTVEGRVVLASKNQQSLMLGFDAMLGGYVGTMPVLMDLMEDTYRDLIEGEEVNIVPV